MLTLMKKMCCLMSRNKNFVGSLSKSDLKKVEHAIKTQLALE